MRVLLACLVALAVCSACGTQVRGPGDPAGRGEWTEQQIEVGQLAEAPVGVVTDGADVLVVTLGEGAVLRSHLSQDWQAFETGEPIDIEGGGYPSFADPVRFEDAWWLVGTGGMVGEPPKDEIEFASRVLRSDDGLTWDAVEVEGIPSPVDVNDVIAADGALIVVGSKRNGVDRGGAGLEAAVWRSEDGATWSAVPLPGVVAEPDYEDESYVGHVVAASDRLLAGGGAGDHGAIWSSEDAGATWSQVDSPELTEVYRVSGLAARGRTVVVSGSLGDGGEGSRILRSVDGGATYAVATDQPASGGEGFAPLYDGGDHFFTVSRPGFAERGSPEQCYADVESCYYGAESDVTLVFASSDGDTWSVLDPAEPDGDRLLGVAGTDDLLLAYAADSGITVNRWPGGVALPEGEVPEAPEQVELVTVPEGEDPQPGVRYHAPLFVHCGMDWLYLGGTPWQRTDGGPDVETGAGDDPSEEWPMAGETIYGYGTLDDNGIVRYSTGGADDELIATYEQTGAQPPGCD